MAARSCGFESRPTGRGHIARIQLRPQLMWLCVISTAPSWPIRGKQALGQLTLMLGTSGLGRHICSVVMHIPVDKGVGLLRLNAPAVDAVDEEEDTGVHDGTTLEEQIEDEASPLLDPLH